MITRSCFSGLSLRRTIPRRHVRSCQFCRSLRAEPLEDRRLLNGDYDFGDADDNPGGPATGNPYPTLLEHDGARHMIVPNFCLGESVDTEANGQPTSAADGDNDDGVTVTRLLLPGYAGAVKVDVTDDFTFGVGGLLDAWMDWGRDGSWTDPGDQIIIGALVGDGTYIFDVPVPPDVGPGEVAARFRLNTEIDLPVDGPAINGEVEDYQFEVYTWDMGDAPEPYPTLLPDGARHLINGNLFLGTKVDEELNGQPHPNALGDDNDAQGDDDDGVVFTTPLYPGERATVEVTVSNKGRLSAWIDFNDDGDWADPDEQIFADMAVRAGQRSLSFTVPLDAVVTESTFARFRVSSAAGLSFDGPAGNGEVEDYEVAIVDGIYPSDFGDAPDPTYPTLWPNGARHIIEPGLHLGATVDADRDGQPDAHALGDDNDAEGNDDDGVTLNRLLRIGQLSEITLDVTDEITGVFGGYVNPYVDAWIDWNRDGTWDHLGGDTVLWGHIVFDGSNSVKLRVPPDVEPGKVMARFRITLGGFVDPYGTVLGGEVEDYEYEVYGYDLGDAPESYSTRWVDNGARHLLKGGLFLGYAIDVEVDGRPDSLAKGDDQDAKGDDEDGVVFTSALIPGEPVTLDVTASEHGLLSAWLDFNDNGTWADAGEQIFDDVLLKPDVNHLQFTVPANATVTESTFARFRVSKQAGLSYDGPSGNGEVEDYRVQIGEFTIPQDLVGLHRMNKFFLDHDGDGKWDMVYRYGNENDLPVSGDFNGDGYDEIGVYRPSNGKWFLDSNANGVWDPGIDTVYQFGVAGVDVPVVGDWDNDGTDEIGVYRPTGGKFFLDLDGNGRWRKWGIDRVFPFGAPGGIPVIGDWDADGADDLGVRHDDEFHLDANGNRVWNGTGPGQDVIYTYLSAADTPVAGDWNADGRDEIGVRADFLFKLDLNGNGTWDKLAGGDLVHNFGGWPGETPLTGKWAPLATLFAAAGANPALELDTGASAGCLTEETLARFVEQAVDIWSTAPLLADQHSALGQLEVRIADLPGAILGQAFGSTITIDVDAAGWGWHVENYERRSTKDEADTTTPNSAFRLPHSMDLLTAVMHELGHVFGFDHDDNDGVMSKTLDLGTRRLIDPDAVDGAFASP